MKLKSLYSVIMTDQVKEVAVFYTSVLNFEIIFDSDWYISLINKQGENAFELAILDYQHETVPKDFRNTTKGLIINFEVENATELYNKMLLDNNIKIVKALKDEDFGQRHFIITDPVGVLIDVIENIPPSEAFADMYKEEV